MKRLIIACLLIFIVGRGRAAEPGYGDPPEGYPSHPAWEERVLCVLTNTCRMAPVEYRNLFVGSYRILLPENYPAVPPLHWNGSLNRSARAHAEDMAYDCGLQHSSCDGTNFSVRIKSYYSASPTIGENIATGYKDPFAVMKMWIMDGNPPAPDKSGMSGDGHRNNIMSGNFREMGAGYAYGTVEWRHFWVQDFGGGVNDFVHHPVASATHLFVDNVSIDFWANYHHAGGAPLESAVVVDGESLPLELFAGIAPRGTYRCSITRASGCRSYYFRFVDSEGTSWRYPETGLLRTIGEGTCTEGYLPAVIRRETRGLRLDRGVHDVSGEFFTIAGRSAGKCLRSLICPGDYVVKGDPACGTKRQYVKIAVAHGR